MLLQPLAPCPSHKKQFWDVKRRVINVWLSLRDLWEEWYEVFWSTLHVCPPSTAVNCLLFWSLILSLFLLSSSCLLSCCTAVPTISVYHHCHDEPPSAATSSTSTASSASAVRTSQTQRAQTGGWEQHLVSFHFEQFLCHLPVVSLQIRIRDPNQGGRDITEEIMSGGRTTSTPTPPQVCL